MPRLHDLSALNKAYLCVMSLHLSRDTSRKIFRGTRGGAGTSLLLNSVDLLRKKVLKWRRGNETGCVI